MKTRMWHEIQDQYEVAKEVIKNYHEQAGPLSMELAKKKRVFLMGTGASLIACMASRYAFIKYGSFIPEVMAASEINYALDRMDSETVVILVSQSGQSYETQEVVKILKGKKVELWGITNEPGSTLARNADRVLLMNAGVEVSSATKTYMATILILYMLAAAQNKMQMESIANIPEDIKQTLAMCQSPVDALAKKLSKKSVIYITGIGPNSQTAAQGALMLKEKTFINAEGMALSEFRHGPIEVVKPGLPIIITASSPEVVKVAVEHMKHLAGLSASVYIITDNLVVDASIPEENIIRVSNRCQEVFSQISEVIPLQLLAEGIANINGYDVDGFKYISKVVDKY